MIGASDVEHPAVPSSCWLRGTEPGAVVVEDRVGPEPVESLRVRGHKVRLSDQWSLGRMCVVGRGPHRGVLSAGASPRGMQGYAVGR